MIMSYLAWRQFGIAAGRLPDFSSGDVSTRHERQCSILRSSSSTNSGLSRGFHDRPITCMISRVSQDLLHRRSLPRRWRTFTTTARTRTSQDANAPVYFEGQLEPNATSHRCYVLLHASQPPSEFPVGVQDAAITGTASSREGMGRNHQLFVVPRRWRDEIARNGSYRILGVVWKAGDSTCVLGKRRRS